MAHISRKILHELMASLKPNHCINTTDSWANTFVHYWFAHLKMMWMTCSSLYKSRSQCFPLHTFKAKNTKHNQYIISLFEKYCMIHRGFKENQGSSLPYLHTPAPGCCFKGRASLLRPNSYGTSLSSPAFTFAVQMNLCPFGHTQLKDLLLTFSSPSSST